MHPATHGEHPDPGVQLDGAQGSREVGQNREPIRARLVSGALSAGRRLEGAARVQGACQGQCRTGRHILPAHHDAKSTQMLLLLRIPRKEVEKEEGEAVEPVDPAHKGQLFIALPDGSAKLYKLRGEAGAPECSGRLEVDTPAKTPATVILRVANWLSKTQRLNVAVDITEKPTAATFIVAANATEIGPNGTKEFPVRCVCMRTCVRGLHTTSAAGGIKIHLRF